MGLSRGHAAELAHTLRRRFEGGFVADGGHRHALAPGANLARLSAAALERIGEHPRVERLLLRLGYTAGSPWPLW